MRHRVVGTAGHIDHGKSALVEALTGVHPDRLAEEKRRGITIELGFADIDLAPDGVLSLVDVPGHERFVRHMVAGASGLDAVLLVIAADEGVKPQTREHLAIASLLGVRDGLIVLSKSDLAPSDLRDVVAMEARELAKGSFLEAAPLVAVSAKTGEGMEAMIEELRRLLRRLPERPSRGVPRLPIDRSFVLKGFGTVVTGTLASGRLREGDEVEILPGRRKGRVRGLEVHGTRVAEASAGVRLAVNLQGLSRGEAPRGATLTAPNALRTTRRARGVVQILASAPEKARRGGVVRFHQGTYEGAARLRIVEPAGEGEALAELRFAESVVLVPGDRFVLRLPAPVDTIGGGTIVDAQLATARAADAATASPSAEADVWIDRIRRGASEGRLLDDVAAELGRTTAEGATIVAPLLEAGAVVRAGGRLFHGPSWAELGRKAVEGLERFHKRSPLSGGTAREALRVEIAPRMPTEAFRDLLVSLAAAGEIRLSGERVATAAFRVIVSADDAERLDTMERAFRDGGLDPPGADEVVKTHGGKNGDRLLRILIERGSIARIRDGRIFHAEALEELRAKLRAYRRTSGTIDVGAFKDLAGVTRRNAIPLLEQFDDERLTRREGNARRILSEETPT